MSWLQPFYGGTDFGQRLAGFLNRLLLLLEFGFVVWHVMAITNGGAFFYSWYFWLIYAFLVILAMKIISSILGFLCRLYLAAKYGATDPGMVQNLGYNRDLIRERKAQERARNRALKNAAGQPAEKNKEDTWKEDSSEPSGPDPYNLEKNREVFRKL